MPGQLVAVFFKPVPRDIDSATNQPLPGYGFGAAAFVVTAPIPPKTSVFFTTDEWDEVNGGFGPRNSTTGTAPFIDTAATFQWITGARVIPAGSVVLFSGIGSSVIVVQDAHDTSADVGAVVYNNSAGQAVSSLLVCSVWTTGGTGTARPIFSGLFTTALLSNQYAGDYPSLSPCLTINRYVFEGPSIYGQGQTFDNTGLPATVQSAMINSQRFQLLTQDDALVVLATPSLLPSFLGMCAFNF
jgi:hypothetical protein